MTQQNQSQSNFKTRTLLMGALIGAVAGLGAGYLLVQRAESEGTEPQMTAGEGVKLGLLLLGVLRQVAQLGE